MRPVTGADMGVEVAVATGDGRAYYALASLLKRMQLRYVSMRPTDPIPPSVRVVLTTAREQAQMRDSRTLPLEALGRDPRLAKQRLLSTLSGVSHATLVVGLDPGQRIGLAAFYQQRELETDMLGSVDAAVERVVGYIRHSQAAERIIRIGNGDPAQAEELARRLHTRLRGAAVIELVDERGTSALRRSLLSHRAARHQRAARLIAFRQGVRLHPS